MTAPVYDLGTMPSPRVIEFFNDCHDSNGRFCGGSGGGGGAGAGHSIPEKPAHDITRYKVQREDVEGDECEHPKCQQLHRRFMTYRDGWNPMDSLVGRHQKVHITKSRYYVIIDKVTGDQPRFASTHYSAADAKKELKENIDRMVREHEKRQAEGAPPA